MVYDGVMTDNYAIRMPNGKLWGEYGGLLSTYQYMSKPLPKGPYVFGSEIQAETALDQLRVAAARLGVRFSTAATTRISA